MWLGEAYLQLKKSAPKDLLIRTESHTPTAQPSISQLQTLIQLQSQPILMI